jgi:hypothetical protein
MHILLIYLHNFKNCVTFEPREIEQNGFHHEKDTLDDIKLPEITMKTTLESGTPLGTFLT